MIDDYDHTSDEESSDSDNDEFELFMDLGKQQNQNHQSPDNTTKKEDSEILPLSTKSDGNCAFHAALGKWNPNTEQYEAEEVEKIREQFSKTIKNCIENPILYPLVRESIVELTRGNNKVQGRHLNDLKSKIKTIEQEDEKLNQQKNDSLINAINREKHSALLEYVNTFISAHIESKKLDKTTSEKIQSRLHEKISTCFNEDQENLTHHINQHEDLKGAYAEYKKPPIDLKLAIDNFINQNIAGLIEEYVQFISTPGQWLIACELKMIAHTFNIRIDYYSYNTAKVEIFNESASDRTMVLLNGKNHYERAENSINVRHDNKKTLPEKRIILFRGIHFCPEFFNSKQRKEATKKEYHQQTIYSVATRNLATKIPMTSGNTFDYKKADNLIKGYFELLKLTPDKPERYETGRLASPKKKDFDELNFNSLYYHFIQSYINSYDQLFKKKGMSRNFNFYSDDNPVLSTSTDIDSSKNYLSGKFIDEKWRYRPKLRKSTRTFKHRRFGYMQVYAIEENYYQNNSTSLDELNEKKIIGISFRHRNGKEVLFESSIPSEFILGYKIFSIPKFNKGWSNQIQNNYGLSKKSYESYQDKFANNSIENLSDIIDSLLQDVTNHQLKELIEKIKPFIPEPEKKDPVITPKQA